MSLGVPASAEEVVTSAPGGGGGARGAVAGRRAGARGRRTGAAGRGGRCRPDAGRVGPTPDPGRSFRGTGRRSAGRSWPRRAWRCGPARAGWPPTPTPPCRRRGDRCPATAAWSRRSPPRWAGGRTLVVGKPEPALFRRPRSGKAPPRLVVGDRLDTDIEGADRAGHGRVCSCSPGVSTPGRPGGGASRRPADPCRGRPEWTVATGRSRRGYPVDGCRDGAGGWRVTRDGDRLVLDGRRRPSGRAAGAGRRRRGRTRTPDGRPSAGPACRGRPTRWRAARAVGPASEELA